MRRDLAQRGVLRCDDDHIRGGGCPDIAHALDPVAERLCGFPAGDSAARSHDDLAVRLGGAPCDSCAQLASAAHDAERPDLRHAPPTL
jgi:hypothetical protein